MSNCPKCGADETVAYMLGLEKSKDRIAELEARNAELLAALIDLVDSVDIEDPGVYCLDEARAAITKAEGE